MIFNNEASFSNTGYVGESKYPLGLEGALMHVYENECNYNAIMRSVGISELKYYQETGGDLFVQEAGALSGLFSKIIAFFKKVIEKIKSIFHKFVAVINQYVIDDNKFVKKYGTELNMRNLRDMEFHGYTFKNLNKGLDTTENSKTFDELAKILSKFDNGSNSGIISLKPYYLDDDAANKMCEENRGKIIQANALSEEDFRTELKERFYGGEKETFKIGDISTYLGIISNAKKAIRTAEEEQKSITNIINEAIKSFSQLQMKFARSLTGGENNTGTSSVELRKKVVQATGAVIKILKSACDDYTVGYGVEIKALKDQNRQAKAICVKALSYKHEAASVYGESYTDDIFSSVTIR